MVAYLDEGGARYLVKKVLDRIQPVGSLYFSTTNTSPASLFGGTWERYAQGRVMVSASDTDTDFTVGKTGGEKTHELRVSLGNIFGLAGMTTTNNLAGISVDGGKTYNGFTNYKDRQTVQTARGMDGSFGPLQVDFYSAIGKLPTLDPYVSVYIWRRTA